MGTIVKELGHVGRQIDLFKVRRAVGRAARVVADLGWLCRTRSTDLPWPTCLHQIDCETCEWETYREWFGQGVDIKQILIELHQGTEFDENLPPNWDKGRGVPAHALLSHLEGLGYVVFHKEPNTFGCKGSCIEYALIKLDAAFRQPLSISTRPLVGAGKYDIAPPAPPP